MLNDKKAPATLSYSRGKPFNSGALALLSLSPYLSAVSVNKYIKQLVPILLGGIESECT